MAIDIASIYNIVLSHAMSTGRFVAVNGHETKQAPGTGLTASIWVDRVTPIKSSGLASTTIRLELAIRIYASTSSQPYDDIDPDLVEALDDLLTAYVGDFDLGSEARHIDIFGAYGAAMESRTGYLNQDGQEYRAFSIQLPIVIDDVWTQTP